jgi:CRP/FNR family transcriptional regulator, cyclic AMP receptor protein
VRLGLSRVFFVMPLNSVAVFASLASRFTLGVGLYARISTDILQAAFHEPAKQAMYAFFPEDIRGRVSMFVRSLASRTGAIVGSGMLIALVPVLTPRWMNLVGIGIALAGVLAAWYFKRHYHRLVVGSISTRHIDLSVAGVVNTEGLSDAEEAEGQVEDLAAIVQPLGLKFQLEEPASLLPLLMDQRSKVRRAARKVAMAQGAPMLPLLRHRLNTANIQDANHLLTTLTRFAEPGIDTNQFVQFYCRKAYRVATDLAVLEQQPATPELELLIQALSELQTGARSALLRLVTARMELSRSQSLLKAASSRDPKEFALALEALEPAILRRLRPQLMPLLERQSAYQLALVAGRFALAVGHAPDTIVDRWWRYELPYISFCASLLTSNPGSTPEGDSMKELLTTPEKLVFLRKVSIFESLTIPELTAIGRITEEKDWRAGVHIFKEGEFGSTMYLVLEGSVEIFKNHRADPVATLAQGAFFGEMALLEKRERSASARVSDPTRTLCIHGYEFEELMKEHPSIPIKICAVLSHRLREAMG